MKTRHILAAFGVAMIALTGCQEEKFTSPSPDKIPVASEYADKVRVEIDPETNNVTFNLDAPGVLPVWIIDGKNYSTVNGLNKIYVAAGDYEIEMKVLNSNGISDGSIFVPFHIENTIFDFDRYLSILAGDGTREWRIANDVKGHLGCGPSGTTGTEWWAAGPDEKADWGLYDNRLMFTKEYQYTFKPGEHGTIYVNKEVSRFEGHDGTDEADFNVNAEEQTATYSLEVAGADLFLVLPKGTYFPYIANNDIYDAPRYRIESLTPAAFELVSDNGGIAWHYTLTSKEPKPSQPETSVENLFKAENLTLASIYWADPNWTPIAEPTVTINNGEANIKVNAANGPNQWQGQIHLNTGVAIEEGQTYDFAITLNPSAALEGVTVKPHPEGDDGHMFSEARHNLGAYDDNVIEYKNFTADFSTANLVITLDFPACPEGAEIVVKNIVVAVANGGSATVGDNLLADNALSLASIYWADPNWTPITEPTVAFNGNNATITVNAANGPNQWQGQIHFNTGVAIEEGQTYNFAITLTPTVALNGVTVKPHPDGDDGHMFSEARHDIAAYEDNVIEYNNFTADFSTTNLVITLDFPACPEGAEIQVSGIEVRPVTGAPAEPEPAGPTGTNIFDAANLSLSSIYWADSNWTPIAEPTVVIAGGKATITVNAANGSNQWQGQIHLNTGVAIEEGTEYDFAITLNPGQELSGVTVKPHPEGDDGHMFSEARHNLTAYEDNEVIYLNFTADFSTANLVITLDFPACTEGTVIEVSNIGVYKH